MERYALIVAGIVFALVALMHLSRLYFRYSIIVGATEIPIWVNVIGLIISAALSFWMFYTVTMKD